ncbi:MAG TPA: hypothetical protein DD671_03255, partial [Balneolaceae bacterium]|nr:hypothetical protein [Balneolaceae bacterium]
ISKYDREGNAAGAFYYPMQKQRLNKEDVLNLYTNVHYRRAIRGADLPDTWPAVAKMFVDDKGRIWIATITKDLENYRWYLLDKAGNPVGTFDLQRKQTIEAVRI